CSIHKFTNRPVKRHMIAPPPSAPGLRLAHLIEDAGAGGAERVVEDLATEFQARGATNVVFLPANGDGWLARQLHGTGVAIEHFRIDPPFSPTCASSWAE